MADNSKLIDDLLKSANVSQPIQSFSSPDDSSSDVAAAPELSDFDKLKQARLAQLQAPSPFDRPDSPQLTDKQMDDDSTLSANAMLAKRKQDLLDKVQAQRDAAALQARMSGKPMDNSDKPVSGMAESLESRAELPKATDDSDIDDELDDSEDEDVSSPVTKSKPENLSLNNLKRIKVSPPVADPLAAAQQRSNMLSAMMMMGKGAEQIGSSLAHVKSDPTYLDEMKDISKQPVLDVLNNQKYQAGQTVQQSAMRDLALKQDNDDPNSQTSIYYKKILQDNFPDIFKNVDSDKLTASQMTQFLPALKAFSEAQANRDAKAELAKDKLAGKQSAADDKKTKLLNDGDAKYTAALMQMKGDKALNNQRETIRRVDNAMSILNNPMWKGNLNNIPQPMVNMVNEDLNFIMQGGVGGQEGFKNISNDTAFSKFAKGYSNVANRPTGAGLGAFVQQNQNVLQDLKTNAQKAVRLRFDEVDNGFGNAARPETRAAQKALLFPEGTVPTSSPNSFSKGQEAGIANVMKTNNIDRATAIKALQDAGKLPQ